MAKKATAFLQAQIEQIEQAEFMPIADMADWAEWWALNGHDMVDDETTCLAAALNCELLIGGGAAPLFRVGFVD